MRTNHAIVAAGVGVLLAAASVTAHHAFSAEFDINKPIILRGALTKWEMINPHSWFHFDVKDESGTVVEWMIEGGSPNALVRKGINKNSIPIGSDLVIRGYRTRDGSNKAVGRDIQFADGRALFFEGSHPPDGGAPTQ